MLSQKKPADLTRVISQLPQAQLLRQQTIYTIATGSCNDTKRDQDDKPWESAASFNPDLWIWLGDNIYADTNDSKELAQAYQKQLENPAYRKFRKNVPIIGIWDDHDYADNNSGADAPNKINSQRLFLDFIGEKENSVRRQQEGIYTSYLLGEKDKQVKIILLDTRYHLKVDDPNTDILGETQWHWLSEQLKKSKARFHIIASGIQVIPTDHKFEKWSNYPKARKRLFDLIKRFKPQGMMILSGDRHIAEFSRIPGKELGLTQEYIVEMTTSGLTHSYDDFKGEKNRYRYQSVYFKRNLGLIQFDWNEEPATAKLQIRDINGQLIHQHRVHSHRHDEKS